MDDSLKNGNSRSVMNMAKDGYLVDENTDYRHSHNRRPAEVQLNEDLYRRFKSKRARWDRNAMKCEKFRAGYQWTQSQINELKRRKKAPIVVNLVNPAVEQLKSLLTMNAPRYNALPREGSDRKTATAFGEIMTHVWQFNRCNVKLKDTIDDYSVKGLGYMMAYWDPHEDFGKGEIIMEDIDPYNVYVDPLSKKRDFSDARHILIVHDWTQEQIQSYFGSLGDEFFKDLQAVQPEERDDEHTADVDLEGVNDTEPDYYRVIDRHSKRRQTMMHYILGEYEHVIEKENAETYKGKKVFEKVATDLQTGKQEVFYALENDEIAEIIEEMKNLTTEYHLVPELDQQSGQVIPVPVPGPPTNEEAIAHVVITRKTIAELVAENRMQETEYTGYYVYRTLTIANKLYWKGYTGLRTYQIVPFPNRHKRNPYPHSDVMSSMDLQKELNVTRMHIMTHTANTAGLKVAVPRGSGKVSDIEDKLAEAGVSVVEFNAEDGAAPQFMYPPSLPSQLYESEKRFENTIYEQFGVYPFMGGGQGGGHSTSSGILIMDELAQRRIASKRTDIEDSLNVLGKVVVELIQRHYTEQKTVRILQPSGRYNEIDLNSPVYDEFSGRLMHRINDVTIGAYDLIVASGSTLPSNRMIRMEYFMKLYAQNLIDQYEVLKNVDEVDAEGVMERMGLLNQLQGQIESLSEEVKKLEGDLQTADREAVGARKRVEVEKFKAELAKMKAGVDKALDSAKNKAIRDVERQADQGDGITPSGTDESLITSINQLQ